MQASKAIYGTTTIEAASGVLNKFYGGKDLIVNELKRQLKNIKPKDKRDNNVVLRLETLRHGDVLKADGKFLSSVFRVVPLLTQL